MHDWMDGDTGGSEKQAMHGAGGGIEGRKAERRAHPTPPACSAAMRSPLPPLPLALQHFDPHTPPYPPCNIIIK